MTNVQVGFALWISVIVAICHTRIQAAWAARVRRKVEADLEVYKSLLEDARTKLAELNKLNAAQKLEANAWFNPVKYIKFCQVSVENYSGVVGTVTGYLNQNHPRFTKRAKAHLEKFTKHLQGRIEEMESFIEENK